MIECEIDGNLSEKVTLSNRRQKYNLAYLSFWSHFIQISELMFTFPREKLFLIVWKVWTQESFQKYVEFDRLGERSHE